MPLPFSFFSNRPPPHFICFPCVPLILPILFPSSCVMLSPVSSLVLFKKSFLFFCRFLLSNQFHLKPLHPNPPPPPPHHSLSHLSLCVAASSEKCLILPLSGVRERGEEEGQPFSLSSFSSAVPPLRLPTLFKAALFFPFHLLSFFPHLFGFPFFFWHAVSRLLSPALADESNTRPP